MGPGRASDVSALVRQLRVLHVAFGVGVVLFGLAVAVVATIGPARSSTSGDATELPLNLLSVVHVGVAVTAWSLARLVLGPMLLRLPADVDAPLVREQLALSRLRLLGLARLVCCETPAMFGLSLVLVAVVTDALGEQPHLYLNALSALVLVAYVVVAWPSEAGVTARRDELLRRG